MRKHDIERQLRDAGERAGEQVHRYADGASERAHTLYDRARDLRARWGQRGDAYGRRLSHTAEDLADEANYHYRRLRRQVNRHPLATAAIVAGTLGAFLLLRRAFRSDDDE
ncbi:hypothetical protein [Rhodanobacter denitrificans]|uniref:DUF883 domain-containing protein n=1 Tax=Rhodanobacter denitrificans TaxID=666685 RepID=M4NI31_9GAMM|nr:hypothetical protein [Rhodanobacter denitrificans]AGG90544.1 hypothetical protein R2APBS1_3481 [Rhodanobacter denitrificans]UJM85927.1 hypothetical protein LRJ86_14220 [Rhodanobacter denitrificans]